MDTELEQLIFKTMDRLPVPSEPYWWRKCTREEMAGWMTYLRAELQEARRAPTLRPLEGVVWISPINTNGFSGC
jgi:hypothetical protein